MRLDTSNFNAMSDGQVNSVVRVQSQMAIEAISSHKEYGVSVRRSKSEFDTCCSSDVARIYARTRKLNIVFASYVHVATLSSR